MIKMVLPIPPSINHCYFYKGGRRIKGEKARRFDETAKAAAEALGYSFPQRTKVVCELTYYFPDARRRDTHNTLKLLLDAVESGGLYEDDRWVLPRIIDWHIDRNNPRVELVFYKKEE